MEACIARDLIDTSAYFWPGYVLPSVVTKELDLMLIEDSPWLTFMQGAPLTGPLQIALMAIPATRYLVETLQPVIELSFHVLQSFCWL